MGKHNLKLYLELVFRTVSDSIFAGKHNSLGLCFLRSGTVSDSIFAGNNNSEGDALVVFRTVSDSILRVNTILRQQAKSNVTLLVTAFMRVSN